jgi:gas vesicle structural protein
MAVERISGGSSLIDVLDRVLDKGIVIDAWVRISLVGIDLITVEARVVVASIDTYLKYADIVGLLPTVARPQLGTAGEGEVGELGATEEEGPRRPPRTPARRAAGRR